MSRSDKEEGNVWKVPNRMPSVYLNVNKSYLIVIIQNSLCAQISIQDENYAKK